MRAPWQLTPHAAQAASNIFQILSLGQADYKPSPILPPSKNSSSGLGLPGNDFQVQGEQGELKLPHQHYNQTHWGQPSYLYVPKSLGKQKSKSKNSVGPGKCTAINSSYTPQGGWHNLPSNTTFDAFDETRATILRYREQVGVNLGSWFVNENWMAPSMFDCATGNRSAELDILEGYGSTPEGVKNATARLEQHWDTWIQEDDFQNMAGLGVNTVRIPIGYWTLGGNWTDNSPFAPWAKVYERSWRYLARGIKWAAKYNIGVVVDLHGAYGAANSGPISGVSNGEVGFFTPGNMSLTTAFLTNLTERLANVTNVVGIEILNEPVNEPELWSWYNETLNTLRKIEGASSLPLYFQDAFNLTQGAQLIDSRPDRDFVVDDTHLYYVYTEQDQNATAEQLTRGIEGSVDQTLNASATATRGNLVVGEWSCALAPSSLQSYGNPQEAERTFCEAENNVFGSQAAGTIYWSYTMEACEDNAGWCFKAAAKEYLTSPFKLWNISNATFEALNRFNGSQQIAVAGNIAKNISSLPIPTLPPSLLPTGSHSSSTGPSSTRSSAGSPSPSRTASSSHSAGSSSHTSSDRHKSQSTKLSSSTHSPESTAKSSSKSHAGSHTRTSSSSKGVSTRTQSSSGGHATSKSKAHSSSHTRSSSSVPTSAPPAGATVVTLSWSEPVVVTTSLDLSGQVTLSLPLPSASPSSSTHKSKSKSQVSSASSHHASAPHQSAKPTSSEKPRESKSQASPSSTSKPSWTEVPGQIVGRSMRGGSPAARAIALVRAEREREQENAKRVAAVAALESIPSEKASKLKSSSSGERARMVVDTGYSDGFLSGKIFASENLGRIGFRGQYVLDSWRARLQAQSLDLHRKDEGDYTKAFLQGLDDSHSLITSAIEAAVAAM